MATEREIQNLEKAIFVKMAAIKNGTSKRVKHQIYPMAHPLALHHKRIFSMETMIRNKNFSTMSMILQTA